MPASLDAGSGANVAAPLSDEQLRATLEKWEQGTRWPLIAEVGPITHELLALRSALRAASDREAALRKRIESLPSFDIDCDGNRDWYTLENQPLGPWGDYLVRDDVLSALSSEQTNA